MRVRMVHDCSLDPMAGAKRTGTLHGCLAAHGMASDTDTDVEIRLAQHGIATGTLRLGPVNDLQLFLVHVLEAWRIGERIGGGIRGTASVTRLMRSNDVAVGCHR